MQEADLSKPFKKEIKAACNDDQQVEISDIHPDNVARPKESIAICKPEENIVESCKEMPPIPTNAVQFLINWKKYTSFDFRYRYLKVSNKLLRTKSMDYIQILFSFSKYHQVACQKYFKIQWKLIFSVVS